MLDEPGGFKMPRSCETELGVLARRFFGRFGFFRQGWLHLRGYQYYFADPTMHLRTNRPSPVSMLNQLEERWSTYQEYPGILEELQRANPMRPRWVAAVSFLEWIVNDLCTLRWLAATLEHQLPGAAVAGPETQSLLFRCSDQLARLAFGSWRYGMHWECASEIEILRRILVEGSRLPWKIWRQLLSSALPDGMLRAVREGDQLWLTFAAFDSKVRPLLEQLTPMQTCLVASNAFGAIHVGGLWLPLMSKTIRAVTTLATVSVSVHEFEMKRTGALARFAVPGSGYSLVIHADDSVFTGRTHERFTADHPSSSVVLVPLTFDIGTIYGYPQMLGQSADEVALRLEKVEAFARGGDGRLSPARSYWGVKEVSRSPNDGRRPEEWTRVVNGSDRLLGMLWQRFGDEICR
jgi:hypothetical protein